MKTHIYLILLLLANAYPAFSQPDKGECEKEVNDAIRQEITNRYGDQNFLIACYEFDLIIGTHHTSLGGNEIKDPYGTLQGRNLFYAAAEEDLFDHRLGNDPAPMVVGVGEGGNILWDSGMNVRVGTGTSILGTMDMTQDGNVEILLPLRKLAFRTSEPQFMWIISWDGRNGKIINATDTDTYASGVAGYGFRVFDYEVDGVKEIRAQWPIDDRYFPDDVLMGVRPCVTFSWNGSAYGMWPDTPQFPCNTYLPMDRLSVSVQTQVTQDSDGNFEYQYSWSNSEDSKQRISEIQLEGLHKRAKNISNVRYGFARSGIIEGIFWGLIYQDRRWMIRPGETQGGFGLRDSNPPAIITYYVQGDQLPPRTWPTGPQLSTGEIRENIYNNSVTGKTIAPKALPASLDASDFTDTLRSYTDQACELQWVTNQGICNSLESKLSNVKRQLERGNIKAAGNVVQAFINEVEAQKDKHLTSEGYGLLYFNAVYLREQLKGSNKGGGNNE